MKKASILPVLVFSIFLLNMSLSTISDERLVKLITVFNKYQSSHPQEKLYIHSDKSVYGAGETIWFKTYLVDAYQHSLDSSLSKVIYVELINPRKEIIHKQMIYSINGVANGDFQLPLSIENGNYILRGYTNFMRNYPHEFMFHKNLIISSTLTTQKLDEQQNKQIDIQFFPEGGHLLSGVENNIAFKAIDETGKSINVEGDILDENLVSVAKFSSDFQGMGSFKLFAWANKKYTASLKPPFSNIKNIELPNSLTTGYMMNIKEMGSNILVYIYCNKDKSTQIPGFNLIAQTRGLVCYAAKGEINSTSVTTLIPKKKFQSGVSQITLFDENGIPQCERLIYIQPEKKLQVKLSHKEIFSKRDLVELSINATDQTGLPIVGSFSLSVYNSEIAPLEEKYPITIENYLMLTSDLTGNIENPGYYFKDQYPETLKRLDLLLLTQGWRRFLWKNVINDTAEPLKFIAEQGIPLKGQILKSVGNKPAPRSTIKILNSQGDITIVDTDQNGNFYTDYFIYFDSTKLAIQTDNTKGKQALLKLKLDSITPATFHYTIPVANNNELSLFATKNQDRINVYNTYQAEKDVTVLSEIEIKASKIQTPERTKMYGSPSSSVKVSEMSNASTYTNILQLLQSRVPNVRVVGTPPTMSVSLLRGYGEPLFLLNGTPIDKGVVGDIQPVDVETIDVLVGSSASVFGSRGMGGVIAIYTKAGTTPIRKPSLGMQRISYPGFSTPKEFYSPKYEGKDQDFSKADLRSTLYWNPNIETDENGNATVRFYTCDIHASYRIIIEGISNGGIPSFATSNLEIE